MNNNIQPFPSIRGEVINIIIIINIITYKNLAHVACLNQTSLRVFRITVQIRSADNIKIKSIDPWSKITSACIKELYSTE